MHNAEVNMLRASNMGKYVGPCGECHDVFGSEMESHLPGSDRVFFGRFGASFVAIGCADRGA